MESKQFLDDNIFEDESDDLFGIEDKVVDKKKILLEKQEIVEDEIEEKEVVETPKKTRKRKSKKKKPQVVYTEKRGFSISHKNQKVIEILDKLGSRNSSDFICQAIIEKYERDNGKVTDLKDLVKDVLEELVGEKFIIMKGSSDIQIASSSVPSNNYVQSAPIIQQSSINNAISSQEEDEKMSLLAGLADDMDD